MISQGVLNLLRKESSFFDSPIHGVKHWQTVERNAHYLAGFNNADTEVLSYFAYFHDCMRENEYRDKGHGPRAAVFAKQHRDKIPLNDIQFKQLTDACKGHTHGQRPECITINTCWDADRLDLLRVGIIPDANRLHNEEAKRIANENDFFMLDEFKLINDSDLLIKYKKVVFDLDHTLIDENGAVVRPGVLDLLNSLKSYDIEMSIWTASTKERSQPILKELGLDKYFNNVIYREDYNPNADRWISMPKDIRAINGDMLVDDSQKQVDYVNSIGLVGYKMTPYASTKPYNKPDMGELEELHKMILPDVEFSLQTNINLFNKIISIFR